jgi:hypothetical protein
MVYILILKNLIKNVKIYHPVYKKVVFSKKAHQETRNALSSKAWWHFISACFFILPPSPTQPKNSLRTKQSSTCSSACPF